MCGYIYLCVLCVSPIDFIYFHLLIPGGGYLAQTPNGKGSYGYGDAHVGAPGGFVASPAGGQGMTDSPSAGNRKVFEIFTSIYYCFILMNIVYCTFFHYILILLRIRNESFRAIIKPFVR